MSSHESKASAGSASAVSARENEVVDADDVDARALLARSPTMPVLPAIALATACASTVSSTGGLTMEGAGAGAEEKGELVVSTSVVDDIEGFANGVFIRGACLLLRCPATSLEAGAEACRRCARIVVCKESTQRERGHVVRPFEKLSKL